MAASNPYSKVIVCLAASRRPGGVCFAGKEFSAAGTGGWIRPINPNHDGAISNTDRQYVDGDFADLLEIVEIPLHGPKPHLHHSEDHQIHIDQRWKKVGKATWPQIVAATDQVAGPLWSDGDSSFHGTNDKVSAAIAATLSNSLHLIAPTRLDLVVGIETVYQAPSIRRVRADFDFNGTHYNFVVTDPQVETSYFAKPNGTYRINGARLGVSLAEVLHGSATKLVAAVITPDRF